MPVFGMISQFKIYLRRILAKNTFARGVSVLVGGTAGAQLLTVLASPLLTRIYSPEDFGLLAIYAGLLAVTSVISSLRYELAIPLPEDDDEAANVASLCLFLLGLSTTLSCLVVLWLGPGIADTLGITAFAGYLWLLPVGVLLSGAYSVFFYWFVRSKCFTTIAGTKLRQAFATIMIQFAAFKLGGIALLFGQIAGQSVGTTRLGRQALSSMAFRQVSWRGIAKAAGRYKEFPIFSTWSGIANIAGNQLIPVFFATFFGLALAGLYALTLRVLSLPASFIGNAIGSVFLSEAPEAVRNNRLVPLVERLHLSLALIGTVPLGIILVFGSDLFHTIFGDAWGQAGVYAQWMAPWLYFQFQWVPLSMLAPVLGLQKEALFAQVATLLLRLITVLWCFYIDMDAEFTIVAFSMVSALASLSRMLWFVNRAGCDIIKIFTTDLLLICSIIILAGLRSFL